MKTSPLTCQRRDDLRQGPSWSQELSPQLDGNDGVWTWPPLTSSQPLIALASCIFVIPLLACNSSAHCECPQWSQCCVWKMPSPSVWCLCLGEGWSLRRGMQPECAWPRLCWKGSSWACQSCGEFSLATVWVSQKCVHPSWTLEMIAWDFPGMAKLWRSLPGHPSMTYSRRWRHLATNCTQKFPIRCAKASSWSIRPVTSVSMERRQLTSMNPHLCKMSGDDNVCKSSFSKPPPICTINRV